MDFSNGGYRLGCLIPLSIECGKLLLAAEGLWSGMTRNLATLLHGYLASLQSYMNLAICFRKIMIIVIININILFSSIEVTTQNQKPSRNTPFCGPSREAKRVFGIPTSSFRPMQSFSALFLSLSGSFYLSFLHTLLLSFTLTLCL